MAVVPRSPGTRGTTSIGVPAGTSAGDLVLIAVSGQINTASTVPSCTTGGTFNVLGPAIAGTTTGRYSAVLWRRATTSESGSYAITAPSGGTVATAEAIALTGVDPASNPYLATGSALAGSTASSTGTPAVSGTIANGGDYPIIVFGTSGVSVTVSTPPAGMTEIGATASSIMHVLGGTFAAGATGSLSATMSGAVTNRSALLVAIPGIPATVTPPASTATALALVPVVTGVVAGDASVTAAVATGTGAALAPTVTGAKAATIAAAVATVAAAALAPLVYGYEPGDYGYGDYGSGGFGGYSAPTVTPPHAIATAQALAPTVTTVRAPTVAPPVATATAQALVPAISASGIGSVTPPPAIGTAAALPPTITAVRLATVTAATATATATALAPTVTVDASVTATTATATASALTPTVTASQTATVSPPPATVTAQALVPTVVAHITHDVTVISVRVVRRPFAIADATRDVSVNRVLRPVRIESVP